MRVGKSLASTFMGAKIVINRDISFEGYSKIDRNSTFFLPLPFHGRRKERGEGPRGIISRAPKYLNNEFRGSTAAPHNNSHRCSAARAADEGRAKRGEEREVAERMTRGIWPARKWARKKRK